ncbi:hypothetical protein A3K72_00115 [Candidatus Woesearchaeota archaeon RBG_13_36_6]|nr:MAG: hypothetical protein A3K72_00115 [Candidatus Woesearchaeota archaeon RBG_13_36_6]
MALKEASILEWVEHYVRHRDMIFGRIENIVKQQDSLIVKYKDGSSENFLYFLDLDLVDIAGVKTLTTIVTLNAKHNLDVLIKKWKPFSEIKDLKIIFINPDSELEKKWIIKPYVHNRICDEKSLKQGLQAMFETVESIV